MNKVSNPHVYSTTPLSGPLEYTTWCYELTALMYILCLHLKGELKGKWKQKVISYQSEYGNEISRLLATFLDLKMSNFGKDVACVDYSY